MLGTDGILEGLIGTLIIYLITIVIGTLAIWLATKLLKFEKQDLKTAVIVMVLTTVISYVAGFILELIPIIGLLLEFLISILILMGLIKYFYGVDWGNAFLVGIVVFGICILLGMMLGAVGFILGVYQPSTKPTTTISGFSLVKTLPQWVILKTNGDLEITFMNGVGTQIDITAVSITNDVSGACSNVRVNGQDPNKNAISIPFKSTTMNFKVTTSNCAPLGVKNGDSYILNVKVDYYNPQSGITHETEGVIRGPYK